jgi:hypothetical protein
MAWEVTWTMAYDWVDMTRPKESEDDIEMREKLV